MRMSKKLTKKLLAAAICATVLIFASLLMEYSKGTGSKVSRSALLHYQESAVRVIGRNEARNKEAKDFLPLKREGQDVRLPRCKELVYEKDLPPASVIITYSHERTSLLLRTLHSVVQQSPRPYLLEVLVIPFGKNADTKSIDESVKSIWPEDLVRVIAPGDIDHIYRARMAGAESAKGEVLIVLDSHCEVTKGWLEPLLSAIRKYPNLVVAPVIDHIDSATLTYKPSDPYRTGGFYFNFTMAWRPLSQTGSSNNSATLVQPMKTPVISGEAFAMSSRYLKTLGGFREEMFTRNIELELSFRTWMCGGLMAILPCSRIGHLAHAYDDYNALPTDVEEKAMIQLAEVWMDEYRRLFYMYRKSVLSQPYGGDLPKDHLLASRKNCSSFSWYLNNVYTNRFLPDENVYSWGVVRNPSSRTCLSSKSTEEGKGAVVNVLCDHSGNIDQTFSYTFEGTIRQEESLCLSANGSLGSPVRMVDCDLNSDEILWDYTMEDCILIHRRSDLCLTAAGNTVPVLEKCNQNDTDNDLANRQIWTFLFYLKTQKKFWDT